MPASFIFLTYGFLRFSVYSPLRLLRVFRSLRHGLSNGLTASRVLQFKIFFLIFLLPIRTLELCFLKKQLVAVYWSSANAFVTYALAIFQQFGTIAFFERFSPDFRSTCQDVLHFRIVNICRYFLCFYSLPFGLLNCYIKLISEIECFSLATCFFRFHSLLVLQTIYPSSLCNMLRCFTFRIVRSVWFIKSLYN